MEAHYIDTVKKNWYALKYVPVNLRTKELCDIAMKQSEKAIEFVPDEIKSEYLPKEEKELVIIPEGKTKKTKK